MYVCLEKSLCDQIQFVVVVVVVVVDHKDDDVLGTLLSCQWGIHGSVLVYLLNSSISILFAQLLLWQPFYPPRNPQ